MLILNRSSQSIRLLVKALFISFAAGLTGCSTSTTGTKWLYQSGLNSEMIGQTRAEFENDWQAQAIVHGAANGRPYRKETQVDGASYELLFYRLYTKYGGTWDHDEWVAFQNDVLVAVGRNNSNAKLVNQYLDLLNSFGRVPEDQLDSIRQQAIEQSATDPICGLARGPGYGGEGLVAIVRAPDTSPWAYMAVVLEYNLPHVIGEVDFYLSPKGPGRYEGQMRWWTTKGIPFEISKCEVVLTTPTSADLVSSISGIEQTLPLRLVSQEDRSRQFASQPAVSSGTGWIGEYGLVVTNFHVVQDADTITVFFDDGRKLRASLVASDELNDLALLRVDADGLPKGFKIRQNTAALGEDIVTLGYPLTQILGESVKMGRGSVSSTTGLEGQASHIQIDAPVHPGNSGGPVFSLDGSVIGIIVARVRDDVVIAESGVIAQNINYAIKSAYLSPLYSMVVEKTEHPTISVPPDANVQDLVKAAQNAVVRIETKR